MNKKLVLVTGMSGAGKSTAMSVMEDMGYRCIDQLPIQLLSDFVRLIQTTEDYSYDYVALSTTMVDFPDTYQILKEASIDFQTLFLDTSTEQLVLRYKFTKHKHPMILMNCANTLDEAIDMERVVYQSMKEEKMLVIDTTKLNYLELKKRVENYFSLHEAPTFSVSFVSFGYKHGIPLDADLLFDVRFLPNPYWEKDLRELDGDNAEVYHYVIDKPETQEYLQLLVQFLNYSFVNYEKEGRNHLTVGIGCTGGQHRSISLVNYLFDHYKDHMKCYKDHRDKKGESE